MHSALTAPPPPGCLRVLGKALLEKGQEKSLGLVLSERQKLLWLEWGREGAAKG